MIKSPAHLGAIIARKARRELSRKSRRTPGAPPGEMNVNPDAMETSLRAMAYGTDCVEESHGSSLDEVLAPFQAEGMTTLWLDVVGLGTLDTLNGIAERFSIHPLAMEDVVHVHQRPKIEDYPGSLFITFRRFYTEGKTFKSEQIGMVLVERAVITFQEGELDCFDPVRERLRKGRGRLRRVGSDYLAYTLLDAAVDHYFPILDHLYDQFARLEDTILDGSRTAEPVVELSQLKKDLMRIRQSVRPLQEALRVVIHEDPELFTAETLPYLRDCHDHLGQVLDQVDLYQDQATVLINLHLSMASQQMNEVMKVLTIISTTFIPLSFIVGLYGMNFDTDSPYNMPELNWAYGYPFILAVMALLVAGMLTYFWRKGWLSK